MTRSFSLSLLTIGATLSMTAGLALAGSDTVSSDQILNALKPKSATRGLSLGAQVDPAVTAREAAKEATILNKLRNRQTRSLSLGERQEIAEIAANKPKLDLEIHFDYNSANISKGATRAVQELGKALSDASLKGSTFVLSGHTDAVGGEAYNQDLSERRADTIKKYLVEQYGLNGSNLVTVGYGKSRPKDANAPFDPANRRVQVVNMDTETAAQ
ncbi:OmpA family protein [Bradyrhizobium sp. WSM 1704]|uniref:OmpA family protein n=1 Tax=Bradyrhizobium semiaridum TaxID=2821404 RepID=UPI001CE35AD4|nr:OmpA family protein [Bradyrhizobium semiaridum]MCA6125955.1 OmpA family protein [Bradyrhizobium semiaridum]